MKTTPWETYDYLQHADLHVVVEDKKYPFDKNWDAVDLQNASYILDLSKCNLNKLLDVLESKGIEASLLVTIEDPSSWTNYTQKHNLLDVVNAKNLPFRSKNRVGAHEGIIIRLRIVVKNLKQQIEEPLQKYSVLDETVFNIHVDVFATEFDVRLVDILDDDIAYRVRRVDKSDSLLQPTQECVYVEFDRNSYNHYRSILNSPAGKVISSMIMSDIISEIAYACVSDLIDRDDYVSDMDESDISMFNKLKSVLGYSSVSELQKDLMNNPTAIRHLSRKIVKLASKFPSL